MGLAMASNLVKRGGFTVHGVDLNEKTLAKAQELGIEPFDKIDEACKGLTGEDFVVTCLPKTEHIEKAMMKDGGVIASAPKGCMIVDTSTIHPIASKQFFQLAKDN